MSDTVTIDCPNYLCQTPNPESHRFCQQCRTFLPKRYLWLVGKGVESHRPGERVAGRYVVKQSRVVLDTQPGLLPQMPDDILPSMEPYLRLVPYQLHVPQLYGVVPSPKKRGSDYLLLEQAPIYAGGVVGDVAAEPPQKPSGLLEGRLMPAIALTWKQSSALRQLNWLWQIAQLWEPLSSEKTASTLLEPDLLRVEGSLVRLLELRFDSKKTPTLSDLGRLWQQWQPLAQAEISDFLGQLCQLMQRGHVRTGEQLVMLLDRSLAACGRSQARQLQIATLTDQGPSRQRNEDACYPPSGTVGTIAVPGQTLPLVVVCDGIGGHEGGKIASNLAIDTVHQQLQSLPLQGTAIEPTVLTLQLEQTALIANDVISQRNDHEGRQERQRMGTTLVMTLAHAHELYLTHVGDSRIYRLTRLGCHQVTLDDDLASREVRLGYALHREALQQSGSGALVQALGMGASSMLHPTVQRFVLDDDCLFLLCSDGLSDNDRVDEYWQSELLPILDGKVDVATASQRLMAIANSKNGHDNVTIGLVYCQVSPKSRAIATTPLAVDMNLANLGMTTDPGVDRTSLANVRTSVSTGSTVRTQVLPPQRAATHPIVALLALIVVLGLGSVFAYVLLPDVQLWVDTWLGLRPQSASVPAVLEPEPSPSIASPTPNQEALSVGSLIQVNRSATNEVSPSLVLWSQPELPSLPKSVRTSLGMVPTGSVLQIASRQAIPNRGYWLKLKVCSMPPVSTSVAASPVAEIQPGDSGWIQQETIAPFVTQNLGLKAAQLGACAIAAPTPSPVPTPAVSPLPTVKPRTKSALKG